MRRRNVHTLFAVVVAGTALAAGWQWLALMRAENVNAAIGRAAVSANNGVPEARFAHALAVAHAGDADTALKEYKAIAQGSRPDLRVSALYNLGNLHLSQAAKLNESDVAQALPLVELAKQSYRDALRADPMAWDARYNLERALRLAPEEEEIPLSDEEPEAPEDNVASTVRGARMDLP